jgi:hypothetical protein
MPVLVSIVVWACVVGGFVLAQQNRRSMPVPHKVASYGIILAGVAAQFGVIAFYDRKRRRMIADTLRTRGFVLNADDGQPATPLHYTPGKGQHSYKPVYSGIGTLGDRPAHIAEYRYSIGHGKGAQHFRMTEFAVDFNPRAPRFTIVRRRGLFAPAPNLATSTDAVNKSWRVLVGENHLTNEFLSHAGLPEVLAVPHKDHEQWAVGDGWVSLTIRRGIKPGNIDQGFASVKKFADCCGG